jgi:methyl-accepting chemotaxis protein
MESYQMNLLSSLKIGPRLACGFGLVLTLLCLMAGVSASQLGRLADNVSSYAANLVPSYETEHAVALALANTRRFEYRHLMMNSDAEKDGVEQKIAAEHKNRAS